MSDSNIQVVGFINFHNTTLLVIKYEGLEYVPLKPINDMVGIDWRTTKRAVLNDDNVILYGIQQLDAYSVASLGGGSPTQKSNMYILLDRAQMFLARINTAQVRVQGCVEKAEALLQLQIEWAKALHDYETKGIAIKPDTKLKFIDALLKIDRIKDPDLKRIASVHANKEYGFGINIEALKTGEMQ